MLWKGCTQYASKFGKFSSGHRTGKGQFSFLSQRKAMPKNAQTTAQLHSSHMLVKYCSEFTKPGFKSMLLLLLLSRFSRVRLFATPWTAAYQAPPSMGFSRQEYWSGVPVPSPQNAWDWVYKLLDFRAVIWYSTEYISPTSRSRAAPVISDTPVFLQKAYE